MRRLSIVLSAIAAIWFAAPSVLLALTPAQQVVLFSAPAKYVGPGNIVSGATAWYGLRAYTAAVAATGTQRAVDLRRASDNAACTAKIATNGSIDLTVGTPCNSNTQTVTAWVGASSALVSKWYDQSGNVKDVSQATAVNQPQLFLSGGSNGQPYLEVTTTGQTLNGASFTPASGVVSFSLVANRSAGTATNGIARENGLNNRINTSTANRWTLQGGSSGTITIVANDATWHAANIVMNGASSVANIDSIETTGTATGNTTAGVPQFLVGTTGTTFDASEYLIYDNVSFTSGQRTALQLNQKAWYALP